jgi:Spy/CpxP family protein refolding chaperone
MKRFVISLLMAALAATGAWAAEANKSDDPIAVQLFPPEAVMAHQQRIGLSDAQRKAITAAVTGLQSKVMRIQWEMSSDQTALAEMLSRPSVNEAEALSRADHLMELERRVKHEHLATLIRIKNTLRPEQQARLRALMAGPESDH